MSRDLKRSVLLPFLLAAAGADASGASVLDGAMRATADEGLGSIGPYRLLAELGSGGMGSVFLAEQTDPVLRRVALKVVRSDLVTGERASLAGASAELVDRFRVERQVLAVTNHDNIVRLYDAGTTAAGEPWFAMEYVPGEPITDYCDRHRLDLDSRLLLFAEVCDAVHHLHELGIQHRDIKPDNVLVVERSGRAVPKLIDLGLAGLTGHGRADEEPVGTPTHMAPEQFTLPAADVDARADVHALGVLLYQLLIGALPFAPVDWTGVAKSLTRGGDPEPPSARLEHHDVDRASTAVARGISERKLGRRLRGDLDRIARGAVAVDRDRRPRDAATLGANVRDHVARSASHAHLAMLGIAAATLAGAAFAAGAIAALAF